MTEVQIEDLRRRAEERCYEGEGINITKEDVMRILAEREALVEGMRVITKGRHCDLPGCTTRACCQAAIAQASIDEAEEKAP